MIMALCLFPLPSFFKLLYQFSSRYITQKRIHFKLICFPSLGKKKTFMVISFLACRQTSRWVNLRSLSFTILTLIPVFALQRCQSCRWQSTSPDSRWRRSSVSMSTGVSASPGAPPEPRRAKKRTSELLVSALKTICCVITELPNKMLTYCMSVSYILAWWLFPLQVVGEGTNFHLTISPEAIMMRCITVCCCDYSLLKSSSCKDKNTWP